MEISIQFLGAAGCVTGSQFLLTLGARRVLVDCGMFQGSPEEVARNRMPFAFAPDDIDAVLLTHAHLDHCGRLPALVRAGYRGPVIATRGTVGLGEVVLRDSAKLQVEFAERWRRRHPEALDRPVERETDDPGLPQRLRTATPEGRTDTREPLYVEADVDQTLRQMRGVAYREEVAMTEGVTAIFHDAGHILGSAIIELRLSDGSSAETVVFSGDLGRDGTPILRDPTPLTHADFLVVESTYGNREHPPHAEAIEALVAAIGEVAMGDGVLLVPAFAIGRTQELIWVLDELVRQGRVQQLPLYLDSPMASAATRIYHDHPDAYDAETAALVASGDSPLDYPGQRFTDTVDESKAIRSAPRPMLVVAASGMLTGGRVMHHLKDVLPDPRSTLLFIGYQGEGTLGRHLQSGGKTARIDGQEYDVRCRIRTISGFSAHADEHELMAWLRRFGPAGGGPRTIYIVHGDPEAAEAFAGRIRDDLGWRAHLPTHRETVELLASPGGAAAR